ncbi:MAG: hypothetical protein QM715_18365 [Nibricoccus sp.]
MNFPSHRLEPTPIPWRPASTTKRENQHQLRDRVNPCTMTTMLLILKRSFVCLALLLALSLHAKAADDTVSVDFPDESRVVILRNIADLFELNVVIPANLPGRTSIKVMHCSWKQIYDLVLKPVGFAWREENGIIKIYDTAPERPLPPSNEPAPVTSPQPETPTPVAKQPAPSRINGMAWAVIGVSVTSCLFALGALVVSFKRTSRQKTAQPIETMRIVAAIIRLFALSYILSGIFGLGHLATYLSMYQRSANIPNTSSASLTGMLSTAVLLLLNLLLGWIIWRAAHRIAGWLLGSFPTNSQPEKSSPQTGPAPASTPLLRQPHAFKFAQPREEA